MIAKKFYNRGSRSTSGIMGASFVSVAEPSLGELIR
jgi:hypothetical protein